MPQQIDSSTLARVAERMTVCEICGDLFGPFFDERCDGIEREQRCGCDRERGGARERRWGSRDFNRAVDLCHCCGAALIKSGSRWDWLFCWECLRDVRQFNGRGNLIPVSRHSIANGIELLIPAGAPDDDEDARNPPWFEAALSAFFARVRHLGVWRSAQAKNLLAWTSCDARVPQYLAKTSSTSGREEAFLGLVQHFAPEPPRSACSG